VVDVRAVAERFAVGTVLSVVPVTEGLMNPNWRLETTSGMFALKQLRDATPEAARRQQRLLPLLAARGVPVPDVRGTRDGDVLAEVGGDWFVMSGWLGGEHRAGPELTPRACRAVGEVLGEIHVGLRALLPGGPSEVADEPAQVEEAVTELERLARIAAEGNDGFDAYAMNEIAWRLRHLTRIGHLRPAAGSIGSAGWTHGDINDLNLLFRGDEVCGVLDWDRLGVRTYGHEVVRTATVMFGADLGRIAAFVAGYRSRFAIDDEALRDAAHRRWWAIACDTWFLRLHYDRGDSSCDHLLRRSGALLRWWSEHGDIPLLGYRK
jgi:homoserine kinase type II